MADQAHIRNFSIIAHIDHGKSTLADRILELTHTVDPRAMRAQLLDSMDLERERGITIKAQAVRVFYESPVDGETYQLHLIDTPGHVDFTYEVSRSLAACEGALLVVDASQGVEAQTVANTYLAVESGLELIPCLNKVDLPGAEPERVAGEVADLLGEPADMVRRISAKTGEGVTDVLDELIARVPPPAGDPDAPTRALIFDSEFDQYRGVVAYIRVVDGVFRKGEAIRAMQTGTEAEIDDIGFFTPQMTGASELHAGEVGYVITGVKDVTRLRVGDTLTTRRDGATEALPGYREVKPMVFCGLFPINSDDYPDLRDALEKLTSAWTHREVLATMTQDLNRMMERLSYVDRSFATDERIDRAVTLARQPETGAVTHEIARSLATIRGVRPQWREELMSTVRKHPRPTLVVWGDRDRILPGRQADAARRRLPHAQVRLVRAVGHAPQVEAAERFTELTLGFLGSQSASPVSKAE